MSPHSRFRECGYGLESRITSAISPGISVVVMNTRTKNVLLLMAAVIAVVLAGFAGRQLAPAGAGTTSAPEPGFTDRFLIESCTFSTTGSNPFFILEPNYRLTLRGDEDGTVVEHIATVLNETRVVDGVETRVVEERGVEGGQVVEIARNYFAICTQTNSVFYFGEDVDMYADGQLVSHNGSWLAGVGGARPGLFMPGVVTLGSRYFHEIAPNVAMDRAEILSLGEEVDTPAGTFANVLMTKETTPLEPSLIEYKYYTAGIGLIQDGAPVLVEYGYI